MDQPLNYLGIVKDNGQRYLFFFDDATPDRELKRVWREHVRDPDLCFDPRDYRGLCRRLRAHRQEVARGELGPPTQRLTAPLLPVSRLPRAVNRNRNMATVNMATGNASRGRKFNEPVTQLVFRMLRLPAITAELTAGGEADVYRLESGDVLKIWRPQALTWRLWQELAALPADWAVEVKDFQIVSAGEGLLLPVTITEYLAGPLYTMYRGPDPTGPAARSQSLPEHLAHLTRCMELLRADKKVPRELAAMPYTRKLMQLDGFMRRHEIHSRQYGPQFGFTSDGQLKFFDLY